MGYSLAGHLSVRCDFTLLKYVIYAGFSVIEFACVLLG